MKGRGYKQPIDMKFEYIFSLNHHNMIYIIWSKSVQKNSIFELMFCIVLVHSFS